MFNDLTLFDINKYNNAFNCLNIFLIFCNDNCILDDKKSFKLKS